MITGFFNFVYLGMYGVSDLKLLSMCLKSYKDDCLYSGCILSVVSDHILLISGNLSAEV